QVAHDTEVSDIEDRGLTVLVHSNDRLRRLHAGLVLDRTGDAQSHIQLRRHGHTGLADLMRLGDVPGIDGRTRRTESGTEDIGELTDELEGLLRTDTATTGDDLLRTPQLRPRGGLDDGLERIDRRRRLTGISDLESLHIRRLRLRPGLDRTETHRDDRRTEGRSRGRGVPASVHGVIHHNALGIALETDGVDRHRRTAADREATGDVTATEGIGHEHGLGGGELYG